MEIQNFIHQHPLFVSVKKKNDGEEDECSACKLPISSGGGTSYGCSQCKEFVIHKSCAELEQYIQHPFHKLHPLILLNKSPRAWNRFTCRACQKSRSGFVFQCDMCDFDLCVPCSLLVPTITYEAHDHLLTAFDMDTYKISCNCCDKEFKSDDPCFRCVDCDFNLHRSCFELPQQIQHPFHPLHALSLVRINDIMQTVECDACLDYFYAFSYSCEECGFNLDIACTSLEPTIKYEGHDHLLTFLKNIYGKDSLCDSCDTYCHKLVLRCVDCDFNVHKTCTEFPKQIQHPSHPHHPLTLGNHGSVVMPCRACNGWNRDDDVLFRCEECDFDLHTSCTSIIPTIKYEGHQHLLAFVKIYSKTLCNFCDTLCDKSVLHCIECDFNIHGLCTKFPKQIQHPFHPLHPLTLGNHGYGSTTCRACNHSRPEDDVLFHCKDCNFNLDTACTLLLPTFEYEGHDHPLTLLNIYEDGRPPFNEIVDRIITRLKMNQKQEEDKGPTCNYCDNPCDGFVFRCVKCDFNSHVYCASSLLPRIIKHKCHIDPLILMDSVVEEGYDEFYCDACETERNPNDPVYYCEECQFVAHITCVVDEVLVELIAEQDCAIAKEAAVIKPPAAKLDEEIQRLGMEIQEQTKHVGKLGKEVDEQTERLELRYKKADAQRAKFVAQTGKLVALTAKLKALKGEREQSITSTSARLEELMLE